LATKPTFTCCPHAGLARAKTTGYAACPAERKPRIENLELDRETVADLTKGEAADACQVKP
jgi:hypothetical protein